ncbi:hypothetical protein CAEBREN_03404 [Caenorhabditis brenneri]|uniref:Uncharacterized protein n=1 Tax=Caenorhabditis brenneri TaxID=135651 RepID=G0NKE4_CAEBE|nr:hypothetical protein CAEBREN_03404 [Caenorhabditis brenneri]
MREQNSQVEPQEVEGIIVDRVIPPENRKFRSFNDAVAFWRERFPPSYFEMKLQAKGIFNLGFKLPELRYFFRPADSHNPLPQLVKQPFVYPKLDYKALAVLDKQKDLNVKVQRLQETMMDYANQARMKDVEIKNLTNEVEMKDQEIERLRKELEAVRAGQQTSSSLPFPVPLAPSASGGPSTAIKRGAVEKEAETPEKKICRVKEEPRDSERWVEETPDEALRNWMQMQMKKEPEEITQPVPQPPQFFPFPLQQPVLGQQQMHLLPNSAFSTSDVIVDNYFQRPAPQRIQTFHEAVGVWTHRFSESLFNRLVRKMPGQGFEVWGPKIQNLKEMTRRNRGPSSHQPIQPPSISPQSNHIPGSRPSQHQQAPMPPNFYIPHHPMQQVQHFVYPQNQDFTFGSGNFAPLSPALSAMSLPIGVDQGAQQQAAEIASAQTRMEVSLWGDNQTEVCQNFLFSGIESPAPQLAASSAPQNLDAGQQLLHQISRTAMMSPIPATMFSVFNAMSPYEFMLMTQQEIQMHQNKMVPTSGSERSSGDMSLTTLKIQPTETILHIYISAKDFLITHKAMIVNSKNCLRLRRNTIKPAPQRIQTFHEAVGVWTHRFSESLFNRLVRKMPGQGFKFWGPKIQNLTTTFQTLPASCSIQSKQGPQLVKKAIGKPKTFYDFLHGVNNHHASDYPRLKKNESNQWKTFIDFLKELMTEQFQAALIFWHKMKPE